MQACSPAPESKGSIKPSLLDIKVYLSNSINTIDNSGDVGGGGEVA
jgi:hypothetical protein